MFLKLLCTKLLIVLFWYSSASVGFPPPPNTINNLKIEPYMGRWFQAYTTLIPFLTYEKRAYCVISDYVQVPGPNQNTWAFNVTVSQR